MRRGRIISQDANNGLFVLSHVGQFERIGSQAIIKKYVYFEDSNERIIKEMKYLSVLKEETRHPSLMKPWDGEITTTYDKIKV